MGSPDTAEVLGKVLGSVDSDPTQRPRAATPCSFQHQNEDRELNYFKRLFDSVVYFLFLTPFLLVKISGQTKSFEKWTQMNAFLDLSPLSEKIG